MKITYLRRDNIQIINSAMQAGQLGHIGMADQLATDGSPGCNQVDSIDFLPNCGAYIVKKAGFKTVIIPLAKTYHAYAAEDEAPPKGKRTAA